MGKVHGSLTRAGKVRQQTPKVEKSVVGKRGAQGRCAMRFKFNRRTALMKKMGKRGGVHKNKLNSQALQNERRSFSMMQTEAIKKRKEEKKMLRQ